MKTVSPIETSIQADIRLAQGLLPHVRLFRNNRGVAWMGKIVSRIGRTVTLENARPVEFGLTDGASDLIGLAQIVITPEMVGRRIAVFMAQEVKRPGAPVPEHQERFINFVSWFGGIAGIVRSPGDALSMVSEESLSHVGAPK
jgi:hypothetical protein